jgi:hypothetical protein
VRSSLDLLAAGKHQFIAVQQVVDALVHLLKGLQVDVVQNHLASTAAYLFEAFRASLLHNTYDLRQFLLTQLTKPLMQSILLGLWHFLHLGQVVARLIH